MTLIHRTTHAVEWHDGAKEKWYGDDWAVVPPELEMAARSCGGFCELSFDGAGNLIRLTPTDRPPEPEREPSQAERLRADLDYLAALQGVTL